MKTPTAGVLCLVVLLLAAAPAQAKIGDSFSVFLRSPLINQLQLSVEGQHPLSGPMTGRVLHRYLSDDAAIVVDVIVAGATIEQELMYAPLQMNRGVQVSFFLQNAVGSVFGAQKGMIAFRAAVINKKETALTFGGLVMRFIPMSDGRVRVQVSR
ncbi:MAG TPA: hypothetical protein VGR24_08855 [bacterium]|jgi:hypothetical protein|nr:hypothetical protein [bacterium]